MRLFICFYFLFEGRGVLALRLVFFYSHLPVKKLAGFFVLEFGRYLLPSSCGTGIT